MQARTTIYADHAATAPLWPSAREAMLPYLDASFGNASSVYAAGREARKAVDDAREQISAAIGARPAEIVFCSGATEADNLAIAGVAERARQEGRDGIVVSAIEHHAVLDVAEWLAARRGFRLSIVPVDAAGVVDLDALDAAVDRKTAILSVMAANNEVGSIQPIARCAEIARAAGARFHTDAVQLLPWDRVDAADADLISITAHKAGGPKGTGALVIRRGVGIEPMLHGGGQERGIRSGTYNVAGIVGFAAAVEACVSARSEVPRVRALRDRLETAITSKLDGVSVSADGAERLPNNCHVTIEGIESEPLLLLLDAAGIAVSSGSACQSGAAEPSHVLSAMGVPKERALGALRMTLGWTTTQADIDVIADAVVAGVERLR